MAGRFNPPLHHNPILLSRRRYRWERLPAGTQRPCPRCRLSANAPSQRGLRARPSVSSLLMSVDRSPGRRSAGNVGGAIGGEFHEAIQLRTCSAIGRTFSHHTDFARPRVTCPSRIPHTSADAPVLCTNGPASRRFSPYISTRTPRPVSGPRSVARPSNALRERGVSISVAGACGIWSRLDLGNMNKRLKALEAKAALGGWCVPKT